MPKLILKIRWLGLKTEVTMVFDERIEIDDDLSAKCCLAKIECNIESSVRGTIFQAGGKQNSE